MPLFFFYPISVRTYSSELLETGLVSNTPGDPYLIQGHVQNVRWRHEITKLVEERQGMRVRYCAWLYTTPDVFLSPGTEAFVRVDGVEQWVPITESVQYDGPDFEELSYNKALLILFVADGAP